jgi:hypothetical protein
MPRILAASGGFLLAVLWMDLMFDVQVLASELGGAPMPESALASSAGYYRHVVTESALMRQFISLVIVVTVGGSLVQATRGGGARWRRILAPLLCGSASTLAALRIIPNAARLGARTDPTEGQSALAAAIFHDHVLCFVAIAAFVAIQLLPDRSSYTSK